MRGRRALEPWRQTTETVLAPRFAAGVSSAKTISVFKCDIPTCVSLMWMCALLFRITFQYATQQSMVLLLIQQFKQLRALSDRAVKSNGFGCFEAQTTSCTFRQSCEGWWIWLFRSIESLAHGWQQHLVVYKCLATSISWLFSILHIIHYLIV